MYLCFIALLIQEGTKAAPLMRSQSSEFVNAIDVELSFVVKEVSLKS